MGEGGPPGRLRWPAIALGLRPRSACIALISDDMFAGSQARFTKRPSRQAASTGAKRSYLFAGMVHCATGHHPLSMQGKARKGHHYYACSYGATYGDVAACDAHAGQKWIYLREDALLPLVEQFFTQRIFGPLRLDKLRRQLKAAARDRKQEGHHVATRLRENIADAERRIKVQVQTLEDGVEPEIVTARIVELRADIAAAEADLAIIGPQEAEIELEDLEARLARLPDLSRHLRRANPETKRQTSRRSACGSTTTRPSAPSTCPPTSPKRLPTPSRTRKASRKRPSWLPTASPSAT